MNYRHSYHAGNFADVLKHAVLALVIQHLKRKPAPFRIVDTHAGAGRYLLSGREAQRTQEWKEGIGRLTGDALPREIEDLLRPYLDVVATLNGDADLAQYPGSPLIAQFLMRGDDALVANELHDEDRRLLSEALARDPRAKVLGLDGWTAIRALLPPKERRGVTLVDPPFEQAGEYARLVQAVAEAERRFATGTLILWHPIKLRSDVERLRQGIAALGVPKVLWAELSVRESGGGDGPLGAAGLVIVNPPYTLEAQLATLLPFLAMRLAQGSGGGYGLGRLDGAGAR